MSSVSDLIKDCFDYTISFAKTKNYYIIGVIILIAGLTSIYNKFNQDNVYISIILGIICLIFTLLISGINLDITYLGIKKSNGFPDLNVKDQLIKGLKLLVVSIVYLIIPIIVGLIILLFTGAIGGFLGLITGGVSDSVGAAALGLLAGLGIGLVVIIILLVIFSILLTMGCCRLIKYGTISEAINFKEAYNDLKRIGIFNFICKCIVFFILIFIIMLIIGLIIALFSILGIVGACIGTIICYIALMPFVTILSSRFLGLLYAENA